MGSGPRYKVRGTAARRPCILRKAVPTSRPLSRSPSPPFPFRGIIYAYHIFFISFYALPARAKGKSASWMCAGHHPSRQIGRFHPTDWEVPADKLGGSPRHPGRSQESSDRRPRSAPMSQPLGLSFSSALSSSSSSTMSSLRGLLRWNSRKRSRLLRTSVAVNP